MNVGAGLPVYIRRLIMKEYVKPALTEYDNLQKNTAGIPDPSDP